MSTWGHTLRALSPSDVRGVGCFKCGGPTTHEATFQAASKGGAAITNRLRYCLTHAQAFAERNSLALPADEPQLAER